MREASLQMQTETRRLEWLSRPQARCRRLFARIEPSRSFCTLRMTVVGASCSLPRVPAKVGLPKRERMLSVVVGNASSCPIPAVRNTSRERRKWVDCRPSTIR